MSDKLKNDILDISGIDNVEQLQAIQSLINDKIADLHQLKIAEAKKEILEMIQQKAKELGVNPIVVTPKVLPRYANPKDQSQVWSGRGKYPRWLSQALKNGAKLEDFRV